MTEGRKAGFGMILAAIVSVFIAYVPNVAIARHAVDSKISTPEFQKTLHEMASAEVRKAFAENATIPRGTIIAWYVKSGPVPPGWAICDGANETPNLVGRYLQGAENQGSNLTALGKGKGFVSIPAHSHDLAYNQPTKPTLGTKNDGVLKYQNTPSPNLVNFFTDPAGEQILELAELPLTEKVLFLIKL